MQNNIYHQLEQLDLTKRTKQIKEVQEKVNKYLNYYHNERPHLSINMKTPKEFAMSHLT